MIQLLLLSIVSSLLGSVTATTAGEDKRYEKIQPLAFGIYTGAGVEVGDYNFTQKIEGCNFPVSEDCRDFESEDEACRDPLCPGIFKTLA